MSPDDWAALDFDDFYRVAVGCEIGGALRETLDKARKAGMHERMIRMAVCVGANIAARDAGTDTENEIAEAARRMWRNGIR
jgi:hypothetical protein